MIEIYHNNRCSKSRCALDLLRQHGQEFTVRDYLVNKPGRSEIEKLLVMLDLPAIGLVRTNETEWKEHYAGKPLSEEEIIDALVTHPKLIERPIVIHNGKAVIGRPAERILSIL